MSRITTLRRTWLAGAFSLALCLGLFQWLPVPRATRELILLAGVAFFCVATLLAVFARCPRCGHLFHDVRGFANPFASRCAGCGAGPDGEAADGSERRR